MYVIRGRNVNDIYLDALWYMKVAGEIEQSRNGKVRVAPTPVATVYERPTERMLFDSKRDANPFFHVIESLWMLAGRKDVKSVQRYASNMGDFSDDGVTLNGAYGFRWRNQFDFDQIAEVVEQLKNDPTTRRAVVSMWDPMFDMENASKSKDVPCNTHIYFRVKHGAVHMTVLNRSNDIIWGCYGANAVHMSYLLEYVALAAGYRVGTYTQVSNNWHVYERHFDLVDNAATELEYDAYHLYADKTVPLLKSANWAEAFTVECNEFMGDLGKDSFEGYTCGYFNHVAIPLDKAWTNHKAGDTLRAIQYAQTIADRPIGIACEQWLRRRVK
jgi:thymidylate synthase